MPGTVPARSPGTVTDCQYCLPVCPLRTSRSMRSEMRLVKRSSVDRVLMDTEEDSPLPWTTAPIAPAPDAESLIPDNSACTAAETSSEVEAVVVARAAWAATMRCWALERMASRRSLKTCCRMVTLTMLRRMAVARAPMMTAPRIILATRLRRKRIVGRHRARRERTGQRASPARYPTPRTVRTMVGCSGSCSILARRRWTCTLTRRVSAVWR